MVVFPQLGTGASALYSVAKQESRRTVVNTLGDGRTDIFSDADAAITGWVLQAKGLTLAEWNAIESLFAQTAGMWGTFTFLDPGGNLLAQSENFAAAAWTAGALIELTPGVGDPLGTSRATQVVNASQTTAGLTQTLAAPGNFQYCLSAWLRSAGGSGVTLAMAGLTKSFGLTSNWTRVSISGNPGQATSTAAFGIQLAAGASVELFGMQAEAQLAPSGYKQTAQQGGVYSKARFAADQLTVTAQATDVYDAVIRIVSTEN